jgi:hypothetical protein
MDKLNHHRERLQKWFDTRTTHQRMIILFLGCASIFFIWYLLLEHPLTNRQVLIIAQTKAIRLQIQAFDAKADEIVKKIASHAYQPISQPIVPTRANAKIAVALNESGEDDQFIKAILNLYQNVQFVSLKNVPAIKSSDGVKNNLQLAFHSSYFDTINYLQYLENLPWCVIWSSLTYKVLKYPEAEVTLNFHVGNMNGV